MTFQRLEGLPSLVMRTGANPLLGPATPTWGFPLVTQAGAFAAHLAYGLNLGLLLAGRG